MSEDLKAKLQNEVDKLSPKPFSDLSLKEKLDLVGIQIVPTNLPTGEAPIDPYGIEESLDLFVLLATIGNKVVNKDSFLDFTLAQKAFATYTGAKEIPKELTHITEAEILRIKETVEKTLKFEKPDTQKLEALVERIVFIGLLLLFSITDYTAVKEQQ